MEVPENPNASGERRKKGGIKTMPFIFANEVSEKLAVVGLSANMVSYLTEQLHMPVAKAATTLTNFGGTASLTPLLGAFIADAYIGRFWTIAAATVLYIIGMSSLTASASLPQLRQPPCSGSQSHISCKEATAWQMAVLYASLLLAALGAGGIRPCVVAFGAEQFDRKASRFFNWYFICMGASMLAAVTVVVYVQDNVGWGWGFGIPTAAMGISLLSFVAGHPLYRIARPEGSPFARLLQVAVAAVRKRRLKADEKMLYENDQLDAAIALTGKLGHTRGMSFLDKAAVITEEDTPEDGGTPNPWRLSTIHRVEELKSLIRMAPIWSAAILPITAASQQNTFSIQQARAMDRRLSQSSSFLVPAGSMTLFSHLSLLLTLSLCDRCRPIPFLSRIGVGFAFAAAAALVAGFVEVLRRRSHLAISVFWLVPQYALFGAAEAFSSVGHSEFFYDQAPESMRSTGAALLWLAISAGSYASSVIVGAVHSRTRWLADDLDEARLELLYWLVAGIQVLNLGYYAVCARAYVFKPLHVSSHKDPSIEFM